MNYFYYTMLLSNYSPGRKYIRSECCKSNSRLVTKFRKSAEWAQCKLPFIFFFQFISVLLHLFCRHTSATKCYRVHLSATLLPHLCTDAIHSPTYLLSSIYHCFLLVTVFIPPKGPRQLAPQICSIRYILWICGVNLLSSRDLSPLPRVVYSYFSR